MALAVAVSLLAGCRTASLPATPVPVALPPGTIVVSSDNTPASAGVARALVARLGSADTEHQVLPATDVRRAQLFSRIQASAKMKVVAIGQPAADFTRPLQGKRVVFCQIVHPDTASLVTASTKGVAAIPPALESLRVWKQLQPKLARVGVITGPQFSQATNDIRSAGVAMGVDVKLVEVKSDKEFLYALKQFGSDTQGVWIVPDHRVLSVTVLRDAIRHARKEGKSVMAFHRDMLSLGATLSTEGDAADIAETVARRLDDARGPEWEAQAIAPLQRADVRINALVAGQLGLKVPPALRGQIHVR